MNPKNTWSLVAVAAAMFAFIFFYERHLDHQDGSNARNHVLFPDLHATAVTRVELKGTARSLVAENNGDSWRLTAPINYPALPTRIMSLLNTCEKLNFATSIGARELAAQPHGLADFGLQPPQATIFMKEDKTTYELRIGAKTPVGEQLYVQVDDRNEVFVVDNTLLAQLPGSVDDWRYNLLLSIKNTAYNRIEIHSGSRGMEFQRDTNNTWRITKPSSFRADNAKINDVLQQLEIWPVAKFISDDPQADLDSYGLRQPDLELILGQGTNDLAVTQFGLSPTNDPKLVYVRRPNQTNIALVPRDWLTLLRGSYNDFRDRRLLSLTRTSNIDQVDVHGPEPFSLARQTNGTWQVIGKTNYVIDSALVNDLLLNLGELQIADFVKDVVTDVDYAADGLTNPALQYSLLSTVTNAGAAPTNQLVARVDFGSSQAGKTFARRADEDAIYKVSEIDLQQLPQALYQLRDREIFNFAGSNVTAVSVVQGGLTRNLVRSPKGTWTLAPGSQGIINNLSVEDALNNLGKLKAEKWVGRGPADIARFITTEFAHSITMEVVNEGKTNAYNITFGKLSPSRNPYATAIVDGQPVVFLAPQSVYLDALRDLITQSAKAQ